MKTSSKLTYGHLHRADDGVIVTFTYSDGLRTLVAHSRWHAFDLARARWGDDWIGEPVISNPWSIYCDVSGITRAHHGRDLDEKERDVTRRRRRRRWREGK